MVSRLEFEPDPFGLETFLEKRFGICAEAPCFPEPLHLETQDGLRQPFQGVRSEFDHIDRQQGAFDEDALDRVKLQWVVVPIEIGKLTRGYGEREIPRIRVKFQILFHKCFWPLKPAEQLFVKVSDE